jgi:uncharacterized protein YkwD
VATRAPETPAAKNLTSLSAVLWRFREFCDSLSARKHPEVFLQEKKQMAHMKRFILPLGVVIAALFMILPASAQRMKRLRDRPSAKGVVFLTEVEKGVYKLTNDVRQKNGLPVLAREKLLAEVARRHSEDMLMRKYFSHVSPDGQNPHNRVITGYPYPLQASGENIWGASGSEPLETDLLARIIVDTWMSSPGHRENILRPEFTDIGVGVAAIGKDIRATQIFARIKQD